MSSSTINIQVSIRVLNASRDINRTSRENWARQSIFSSTINIHFNIRVMNASKALASVKLYATIDIQLNIQCLARQSTFGMLQNVSEWIWANIEVENRHSVETNVYFVALQSTFRSAFQFWMLPKLSNWLLVNVELGDRHLAEHCNTHTGCVSNENALNNRRTRIQNR